MASDAQIRAWAKEAGQPHNDRGKVSQALSDAYDAAHNGHTPGPDYPEGMTDADFDLAEAQLPDDADMTEDTPAPVRRPKAGSRTTRENLTGRLRRGARRGKPKPKQGKRPRVSTSDLIGSAWRIAAKVAQPLPPLYRTLRLQSVIAGPLLDDAVKGTMLDPFLQPLARLGQAGGTLAALLAPNMAIGAMALHLQQTGGQPNPVVMQTCQEMLRYGLMQMMHVGGDAFAAQLAKDQRDEEQYGASVDVIMAFILADPADAATEEANIARMAARFAGQPEPEPAAM